MTKKTEKPNPEYSNLFMDLAKHKQPTRLVDLPVYDDNGNSLGQVLLKTLVHEDHEQIQKAATFECDRIYKEEKISQDSEIYKKRYDNVSAKHFIFRVCRDPENEEKPFFPTPDHVGKFLTNDQIVVLLRHYETLQNERGPLIAYMSNKQFEEWIDKLGKSAEEGPYFLDRFLPEAKDQFLMYMANLLWTSQTDKSSAGSPPEDSSKDSPPAQ